MDPAQPGPEVQVLPSSGSDITQAFQTAICLFLQIGGPVCGCPHYKRPTIEGLHEGH